MNASFVGIFLVRVSTGEGQAPDKTILALDFSYRFLIETKNASA